MVLLLGQRASLTDEGIEPLLAAIRVRFGLSEALKDTFDLLFEINGDGRAVAAWLAERARNQPFSEALRVIAGLPWNAVFTSSVCPLVGRAFRSPWRTPQDVAAVAQMADAPQNRQRLTITWLFGRLDEDAGSDRAAPILSRLALRQRRLVATSLLSRIPDVVTHYGTLVIDDLDPRSDWLRLDDLVGLIAGLQTGQAHWFSWPADEPVSDEVAELQKSGLLVLHPTPLNAVLLDAASVGRLPQLPEDFQEGDGRTVLLNGRHVAIPRGLLARAEAIGRITGPARSAPPSPLDADSEYGLLREFLRDAVGSGMVWEAATRGFVVSRSHDALLRSAVELAIRNLGGKRRAVLLAGAAGCGRSVSLARLAIDMAQTGKALVYFIEGQIQPPEELLEDLAKFATAHDAAATILIWDGNHAPSEYQRLVDSAYSRGDNLVVVGSCYRTQRRVNRPEYVEVNARLNDTERVALGELLHRFGLDIGRAGRTILPDDRLLVLLYRFVPTARPRLGAALSTEAQHFSFQIRRELRGLRVVEESLSALAAALIEAGLASDGDFSAATEDGPTWQRSAADALIAMTVAVGRHGLSIPLELAVRASMDNTGDNATWTKVEQILRDVDIVEIRSESDGLVRIAPRHQVEARILCDRLLGGADREMQLYASLAESARYGAGIGAANDPELRFVTELCAVIGPNAYDHSVPYRYRRLYGILAAALRRRRNTAPLNTDLAMQEAVLWREDMIARENEQGIAPDDAVTNVQQAIELLDTAVNSVRKEGWRARHLRNLRVERATLVGSLTVQLISSGASRDEIMARLDQVWIEAQRLADSDPTFYHTRDVLLWTASSTLAAPSLTPEDRAKVAAEVRGAMTEIREEDLLPDQLELYLDRKQKVGRALGDFALSESALQRLREIGSSIPDRLAALDLAGEVLTRDSNLPDDNDRLLKAKALLSGADGSQRLDSSGRRLLLRLSWRLATGRNLFAGERAPTPSDTADVTYCRAQAEQLVIDAGGDPPQQFMFLMAVLAWIEGDYTVARDVWQQLEEASDRSNPSRIRKHLVMHGPGHRPVTFRGRIASVHPNGRTGRMRLDENGQQVHISATDFGVRTLRRDENLEVCVAFNYLGPVAIAAE
jgi:hypothetical protein